jgi:hypothetical protein
MTLEIRLVSQDRQACRARSGIGLRMGGRIKIFADKPLGRARLLDFRDEAEAGAGGAVQCLPKAAWRRLFGGAGVKGGHGDRSLAACYLLPLRVADFDELVGH